MLKNDLASDRTSDHRFLANHLRLFFACAAYVLHQSLRTEVLVHTADPDFRCSPPRVTVSARAFPTKPALIANR